jgi:hypothetical protein
MGLGLESRPETLLPLRSPGLGVAVANCLRGLLRVAVGVRRAESPLASQPVSRSPVESL